MNFRFTSKLIQKYIRHTNCKYSASTVIHKQPTFFHELKNYKKTGIVSYSTNSIDLDILILPKHIKNGNLHNPQDIDKIIPPKEISNLTQEQRLLLIECCGALLSNKNLDFRIELSNNIFQKFDSLNCLSIKDYNAYIKVCTENEVNINSNNFLKSMKCEPNEETFKLLLENVCEKGDTSQAYDILSKIKDRHYSADERVFNALILTHAITDGLQGVKDVLTTMRSAHISPSPNTNWNVLIGLATNNNTKEFTEILKNIVLTFDNKYFFKLILKLALNDNEGLINEMKRKFDINILSRTDLPNLEFLCIHLIHRSKARVAVEIYCTFTESNGGWDYGRFLLEEMLKTEIDSNEIVNICRYLNDNGRNQHALSSITEIALRKSEVERAWFFLQHFEQLRPHYFWPLLIDAANQKGEIGVINVLQKLLELKVQIDSETLELYTLPYCDILLPKSFLKRVSHLDLSMRQLFTPLLVILLRNGQVNDASQLCNEYKVPIDGNRLVRALALGWRNSKKLNCILKILKRVCESNEMAIDYVGSVLIDMLKLCRSGDDYIELLKFIKLLRKEKLSIVSWNGEILEQMLQRRNDCSIKTNLSDALNDLLDVSMKEGRTLITHPRDMTLDELECHLIELTNKNMKTRGVLRRLIQVHGRYGNYSRVQELRTLFKESGYEESLGMKAAFLQTCIQTKQSQSALEIYRELRTKCSYFKIDVYKLIDLAALLVSEDKFEDATKVLEESCYRVGGKAVDIEHNCIDLLNAAKTPEQVMTLFQFLINRDICKPKNVVLGPVLKSYLKCKDFENAVDFYETCCKKYKLTPLQVELLQALIDAQQKDLLDRALNATATIYGRIKTQVSFVVALAEKGMKKVLAGLLMDMKHIPGPELQNRCDRWIHGDKLEPLLTLEGVVSRLKSIEVDINIIHLAIVQVYSSRNDSEGALNFINGLKEKEVIVSQQVVNVVNELMKRNKIFNDKINLRDVS